MASSRAELGRRGTTVSRTVKKIVDEKERVEPPASPGSEPKGATSDVSPAALNPTSDLKTKATLYNERVQRARSKRLAQTNALIDAMDGPAKSEFTDLETAMSLDDIIPEPIVREEEAEEKEEFTQRNGKWYDAQGNEIKPKQVLRLMWGDRHYDIVLRRMRKVRQSKKTAQS